VSPHKILIPSTLNLGNVRKRLLVKYSVAPLWTIQLLQYAGIFTKRRLQLEFAMAMHPIGVETADVKLDAVIEHAEDLSEKYANPLYPMDGGFDDLH
jgi:hypothetical protein